LIKRLSFAKRLDDAVDKILVNEDSKSKYFSLSNNVRKFYKAILPDMQANKFRIYYELFSTIQNKIKSLDPEVDISEVKAKIEDLFDRSISIKDYVTGKSIYQNKKVDLSQIDFEKIRKRFVENKKHIETEKLKNAVRRSI